MAEQRDLFAVMSDFQPYSGEPVGRGVSSQPGNSVANTAMEVAEVCRLQLEVDTW